MLKKTIIDIKGIVLEKEYAEIINNFSKEEKNRFKASIKNVLKQIHTEREHAIIKTMHPGCTQDICHSCLEHRSHIMQRRIEIGETSHIDIVCCEICAKRIESVIQSVVCNGQYEEYK